MGLTLRRVERHVQEWEAKLSAFGYLPHRERWPSRLFHHSPIQNAAQILSQGAILSRRDSEPYRKLDVAGSSVIQNRDRAHQFGRLYFRPRTPTQFRIEGIRSPDEFYNGDAQAHAPTLVMLIFDARKILVKSGVRFSTGNMQSHGVLDGDTDEFFDTIDFAKVFHEGAHSGDPNITRSRCAEVLVPSPMALSDCLTAIHCRSVGERQTLLYDIDIAAKRCWRQHIHISDDLRVFEKRHTFVDTVSLQQDGIVFKLHPPEKVGKTVDVRVEVWDNKNYGVVDRLRKALPVVPPNNKVAWHLRTELKAGVYRVRVTIEDCRAFEAKLLCADGPF